jgi:hypothetical protein
MLLRQPGLSRQDSGQTKAEEPKEAKTMSDGSDYLKYVTQRVVTYWETPKAPEYRRERRQRREPWVTRWFGQLLPMGILVIWNGRAKRAEDPVVELPGLSEAQVTIDKIDLTSSVSPAE